MAVKTRIGVEVEAAQFAEFYARFQEYRRGLDEAPRRWREAANDAGHAKTMSERARKALSEAEQSAANLLRHTFSMRSASEAVARSWTVISRSTSTAAGRIKEMTTALLRWAGVRSLISGLVGAGAITMFGIGVSNLTESVAGRRTAAFGSGASYGGHAAFGAAFGRLGDPSGILGRIGEAQSDPERAAGLRNLGLSNEDIQGPTEDAAGKAILALRKRLEKTPTEMIGPLLEAMHLEGTFSTEEARIIKGLDAGEIESLMQEMRQSRERMDLSKETQRAWQDLSTQMSVAGRTISTIFAKNLAALAKPISNLSDAFVHVIEVLFEKSDPLKKFLDGISKQLERFAAYLKTPEFHESVSNFIKKVGELATWAGNFLSYVASWGRWLGILPGSAEAAVPGDSGSGEGAGAGGGGQAPTGSDAPASATEPTGKAEEPANIRHGRRTGQFGPGSGGHIPEQMEARAKLFHGIAKDQLRKEGVPEANLDAAAAALAGNARAESGFDPTIVHDNNTGYGIYGARLARRDAMLSWMTSRGYAKESLEGQTRYMAHEAMTSKHYKATADALRRATPETLDETTATVSSNFERPGTPRLATRQRAAQDALRIGGQHKVTITETTGGNPINTMNAAGGF